MQARHSTPCRPLIESQLPKKKRLLIPRVLGCEGVQPHLFCACTISVGATVESSSYTVHNNDTREAVTTDKGIRRWSLQVAERSETLGVTPAKKRVRLKISQVNTCEYCKGYLTRRHYTGPAADFHAVNHQRHTPHKEEEKRRKRSSHVVSGVLTIRS